MTKRVRERTKSIRRHEQPKETVCVVHARAHTQPRNKIKYDLFMCNTMDGVQRCTRVYDDADDDDDVDYHHHHPILKCVNNVILLRLIFRNVCSKRKLQRNLINILL